MSRFLSNMKSGDSPIFWLLFAAGTIWALIYAIDQMTNEDLMGAMWRSVKRF